MSAKLDLQEPGELKDTIGLLTFGGDEKMFAIDGQHRVEGIKLTYKKEPERVAGDQYPVIFVAGERLELDVSFVTSTRMPSQFAKEIGSSSMKMIYLQWLRGMYTRTTPGS
jgi:hypothetical protein